MTDYQGEPGAELVPTSSTEPIVFRPAARTDTDSWIEKMAGIARLSEHIANTDFVPKGLRGNVPATTAAILYGREVGLPPMTTLTQIHVIEGRPGMSAEGMRALVLAAGHELDFVETTGAICRMRARRRGATHWTELAWSLDMARAAKLNMRDNWVKHPRAMLIARCTTDLCRMVFPDVIHGFRSVEELTDMDTGPSADSSVPDARRPAPTGSKVRRGQVVRTEAESPPRVLSGSPPAGPPSPPQPPLPNELERPPVAPPDAGEATPHLGGSGTPAETPAVDDVGEPVAHPSPSSSAPPDAGVGGGPSLTRPPTPAPDDEEDPGERQMARFQQRLMFGQLGRLGLADDPDEQRALISALLGREVTSRGDLTAKEAAQITNTISRPGITNADDLRSFISAAEAARLSPLQFELEELPIEEPL